VRKIVLAAVGAAALATSGVCNAAINVTGASPGLTYSVAAGATSTTISYESPVPTAIPPATFTGYLTVENTVAGIYSVILGTTSPAVDFLSAVLTDGMGGSWDLIKIFDQDGSESWFLKPTYLAAGTYTLTATGTNSGEGGLGGTITIRQAVPEPATWGLMLLGFAGVGFAMRRSKKSNGALLQLA
jgi:hypothetical protein